MASSLIISSDTQAQHSRNTVDLNVMPIKTILLLLSYSTLTYITPFCCSSRLKYEVMVVEYWTEYNMNGLDKAARHLHLFITW